MAASILHKLFRSSSVSKKKITQSRHIDCIFRTLSVGAEQIQYDSRPDEPTERNAKFDLFGALVLERKPVVAAQMAPQEKKYQNLLEKIELQKSDLSEHECRHQRELELAQLRLRDDYVENSADVSLLTAVDMEDIWTDERNKFKPADKITEADNSGQTNTTQRKLDRSLYLVVKQSFGSGKPFWVFPQTPWQPGVRALSELSASVMEKLTDKEVGIKLLGHAPFAYYRKLYPAKHRAAAVGAKVFFHKAVLSNGDIGALQKNATYLDFGWLTPGEIQTKVDKPYWTVVKRILHDF